MAGRRDLTVFAPAPASDGAVGPHPAGVAIPEADGDEGTFLRVLDVAIVAPAGEMRRVRAVERAVEALEGAVDRREVWMEFRWGA